MAIALVQTATQVQVDGSSTTAPSITITGTTAGNCLVAFAGILDLNLTWLLDSVTDGGNTWTVRAAKSQYTPASQQARAVVAWAVNITGGSRTVAFNLSGTSGASGRYYTLGCLEFSGVATTSAEDTFDVNENIDISGAVDASAGPVTTTETTDLIVGCAAVASGNVNLAFASPASWTNKYRENDASAHQSIDAGYWLPGAIQTTYTAQWSHANSASEQSGGSVVALKQAAAAAAISYIAQAVASSSPTANTVITLPTGSMAVNDLILIAASVADTANNALAAPSPATWTDVVGSTLYADDVNDVNLNVFYKYWNGTDTTATFTNVGGTNASNVAVCMVFRGVATVAQGGPFTVTSTTATGINTSNADPAQIATTTGDAVVIVGASGHTGGATATYTNPTNYTTNAAVRAHDDTIDGLVGMGYRLSGYSNPENPGVFTAATIGTATDNAWAAVTMALKVAPAQSVVPVLRAQYRQRK